MYHIEPTCQIPGLAGIYAGVFGYPYIGTFVEVGAYDGKTYSNTYGLATMGWSGMYVEPNPLAYVKCTTNHKTHVNVEVLAVACSNEKRTGMLREGADIHTLNVQMADILGAHKLVHSVEITQLDDLLITRRNAYGTYRNIDLLVIDVEGEERNVLEGFSLQFWMPRMVIIEAHEFHTDQRMAFNAQFINNYFARDYRRIYADSINNIYLRKE